MKVRRKKPVNYPTRITVRLNTDTYNKVKERGEPSSVLREAIVRLLHEKSDQSEGKHAKEDGLGKLSDAFSTTDAKGSSKKSATPSLTKSDSSSGVRPPDLGKTQDKQLTSCDGKRHEYPRCKHQTASAIAPPAIPVEYKAPELPRVDEPSPSLPLFPLPRYGQTQSRVSSKTSLDWRKELVKGLTVAFGILLLRDWLKSTERTAPPSQNQNTGGYRTV